MATLVIENVPDETLEALKTRAEVRGTTMGEEILDLVTSALPSTEELRRRQAFWDFVMKLRETPPPAPGPFQTTEELIREMREEDD